MANPSTQSAVQRASTTTGYYASSDRKPPQPASTSTVAAIRARRRRGVGVQSMSATARIRSLRKQAGGCSCGGHS